MLINSAEFLSTNPGLGRQSFAFKPDILNLLSTDDDRKKSELFSSISLVLWGKIQDNNGSESSELAEGSLALELDGKKLVLSRNFESNLLEFKSDDGALNYTGADDILSGISKDMFNSLFIVGQDEVSSTNFVDRTTLLSLLGQFASLSEHSINLEKSVKLLEDKLAKYPFRGKAYKLDDLIAGLTRGKIVLEERLMQLERERKDVSVHIQELNELESDLAKARSIQKREEYFQLCLETAELDSRIMKVQLRLLHELELKKEISAFGDFRDFPIDSLRKVQELWTMRASRIADMERMNEDIALSNKEIKAVEEANAKEAQGLDQFQLEDAQQLYGLATTVTSAQQELEQLKTDRAQEMRQLKETGVDFDNISLVRKFIMTMSPADLEEANDLSAEIKWQKDKLTNLVSLSENTGGQLKVMSEEIVLFNAKSRNIKLFMAGLATVSALVVIVVIAIKNPAYQAVSPIFLTSGFLSFIGLWFLPQMYTSMRRDFESKVEELVAQQKKIETNEVTLGEKIGQIQKKAEIIAEKYGVASSAELFKNLHSYSSISAQLKRLDLLDHMLAVREKQLDHLVGEAQAVFQKINRKLIQVTPAAITGLASEILRYRESSREVVRNSAVLNHRISELSFLAGEILELDGELRDLFRKAKLATPENIQQSFEEFEQKAQAYRKWESLSIELESMEKSISAEILENDLASVLSKMQHRRTDAWSTMQDLIVRYPDILTETIEDEEMGRLSKSDAQLVEEELVRKQARVDALRQLIRSAAKTFDEFHPKTQHELEILERDLDKLKHNRNALLLACDSLRQVAEESKSSWSQELAAISADMLADTGLEVNKIEWDNNMEMTLSLVGQDEPIHESALASKVSRGLIKQLNWVARLMLCRYIARRLPLPLVLDEPFCDLDDKRFAGCMNLLVRKILPHCQLIVLTCQRVRHQWYVDKLSVSEKKRIQFV